MRYRAPQCRPDAVVGPAGPILIGLACLLVQCGASETPSPSFVPFPTCLHARFVEVHGDDQLRQVFSALCATASNADSQSNHTQAEDPCSHNGSPGETQALASPSSAIRTHGTGSQRVVCPCGPTGRLRFHQNHLQGASRRHVDDFVGRIRESVAKRTVPSVVVAALGERFWENAVERASWSQTARLLFHLKIGLGEAVTATASNVVIVATGKPAVRKTGRARCDIEELLQVILADDHRISVLPLPAEADGDARSRHACEHSNQSDLHHNTTSSARLLLHLIKECPAGGSSPSQPQRLPQLPHLSASEDPEYALTVLAASWVASAAHHSFARDAVRSADHATASLRLFKLAVAGGNFSVVGQIGPPIGPRVPVLKRQLQALASEDPALNVTVPVVMNDGGQLWTPEPQARHVALLGHMRYRMRVRHLDQLRVKMNTDTIPFALGDGRGAEYGMDTPMVGWDAAVARRRTAATRWEDKRDVAVFRGGLYPLSWAVGSCASAAGCRAAQGWVNETLRGLVASLDSPLVDAGITKIKGFNDAETRRLSIKEPLTFEQQQGFKVIMNLGQNTDWADRLPNLLCGTSAVLVHEGVSSEWFRPLLRPWVHYIPTRADASDLLDNLRQAFQTPERLRGLRDEANAFCRRFLSEAAMSYYNREVLAFYSILQDAGRT